MISLAWGISAFVAVVLLGLLIDLVWCTVRDCRNRALQNRRIRLARNARACERIAR